MLSRELNAATARPAVLAILAQKESYGYEIIQQVRELSGGQIEWAEGVLYPMLHRLEREGVIVSSWKMSDTGRKRKYYRITAAGQRESAAVRKQWARATDLLNTLWRGELSHV